MAVQPPLTAQEPPPEQSQEITRPTEEQRSDDEERVEEADGGESDAEEEESTDQAPDALHDPIFDRLLKGIVIVDRPGLSIETRGKLQVQYLDADSEDPDREDDLFIRRLQPKIFGQIGRSWSWKFELEINTEVEEQSFDVDELDVRRAFIRYDSRGEHSWRLSLGHLKAPYSRERMTHATHLLQVDWGLAADRRAGVPDWVLGIHHRAETKSGRFAYWATVGELGHNPGVDALEFNSVVGGSGDLNTGLFLGGRVDFHPRGPMTYSDGDQHTPEIKTTWSLAGYSWENDGSNNSFSEGGVSLDPEKADLDSAAGFEISGGLRGRGITVDWQHNRIRGETLLPDFSGGIYRGGETRLNVTALEGGYWFRGSLFELGGAVARLDSDSLDEAWDEISAIVNLHGRWRFPFKLQISHTWSFSHGGVPRHDFQFTRIQFQYVW